MVAIDLISYVLTCVYVVVVTTFIRGWYSINFYVPDNATATTTVSILVAARNEADHIENVLQDLLAQNFPSHLVEIIVINDHSTDETATIVNSFANQGVKLINLNESKALNSYKKKAIQTAIAQSRGELIITTDADCCMGQNWLNTIVSFYEEYQHKMISSPVCYFNEQNIFEKSQALEFSYLIGIGAATIGNKNPSTCNGANLAYERKAFDEVGGFKGIDDLASGDDELLLHKIAAKYRNSIGFLKNTDAIVYTRAKSTLVDFLQQRKRWASKSTKYKNKGIVGLGLMVWLFNLSILSNAILSFLFKESSFSQVLAIQLLLKVGIEMIFLTGIMRFFKKKNWLILQPLVSLLHIIYIVYIGIAGNSGKYRWKGRMVK